MAVPTVEKRVLYYAARPALSSRFFDAVAATPTCSVAIDGGALIVTRGPLVFHFVVRHDVPSALDAIHHGFFNLVLLDLREPVTADAAGGVDFARGVAVLEALDREPDIERRYGFHRIVVLVSGDDAAEVDTRIATLGAHGVGRVMRDLAECRLHPGCDWLPAPAEFARRVLDAMAAITEHHEARKTALCASGGGITGLYFEMGALKCLEDCCSPRALNDCDLYFGISAGAVLCGMLANGYSVTEFMGAVAGEAGRLAPIDLNVLGMSHIDLRGITAPLCRVLAMASNGAVALLRGRLPFSLEALVFEYGDLVHAPFNTSGFGALLEDAFTRPGHTNDFRALGRQLFVGATDQDRKEHVLFGEAPYDAVPISLAIEASMSLNPVFAPTGIDGRYYEDGAVTRTSNFVDAIGKGADLIFSLDPLVPYVSRTVGFTRARGVVYNADQDIRTVFYTRYENTRNWVLRRHPDVSMYTFLPANHLRQVMSINPMDHRPFLEIWRGAYLGTLKRIQALEYRMRGDLAFHGIHLDTARAAEVAARLAAQPHPSFADFFPDGVVDLGVPEAGGTSTAA